MLLVADSTRLALAEGSWIDAVKWLPDGTSAAVEITERTNGMVSYAVWNVPIDGSFPPYRVDSGAQPYGGLVRSPNFKRVLLLGINEISTFPRAANENLYPLLDYVPRIPEGENTLPVMPILSWDAQEMGFFTYIPISDEAPPDDNVGGHLWYVAMDGSGLDLGKTPKLAVTDFVISSGDGKALLVFHTGAWTIRDAKTGAIVQTVPPSQLVFGWTPDNKGVLYRDTTGAAKYLGIDGSTDSPYAPNLTNLFDIKWLADGSSLYVARGKDNKLSFSLKQQGKDPAFLGIVSTVDSYKARILYGKISTAVAPEKCK
jgi:hypothetical protein